MGKEENPRCKRRRTEHMEKELLLETIERYLTGNMSPEEAIQFEEELSRRPSLLAFTEQHAEVMEGLSAFGRQSKLRALLDEVHRAHFSETATPSSEPFEATKPIPAHRFHFTWRVAMVAASVAVLVSLGGVLAWQNFYSLNKTSANFRALRREVDKIKRSQTRMIEDLNVPAKPEGMPGVYGGTGFALSANGYLITSYHVVKGGDSVYVENVNGQRYKAKVVLNHAAYDLTVLKIIDPSFTGWKNLPLSFRKRSADLGERIYTLGFPREDIVYGEGSIASQTGFDGDTAAYQVSIPVNPGNSGGPVLDDKGNVVGLISGKETETEGAAFAIKSDLILKAIEEAKADTAGQSITLPKSSGMAGLTRAQQVKRLRDFVFLVKVYN
jgi:S1-C subfamily serine protease